MFGGHRNYDGYDNIYSATASPESRSDPWFNGNYKGDDEYIPEEIYRPPSEVYFDFCRCTKLRHE
jgi:hypothetical protein